MHGGREGVVGRLRLIDVVVGVQNLLRVQKRTSAQHVATVGNHLIDVHVALGA